ncbi:MAG: PQQ-binding-like beta-propeller repeat protein, partial [Planctomycetaceae bacterium]
MTLTRLTAAVLVALTAASVSAADWSQWRGNRRNGIAEDSPALMSSLPAAGLNPVWMSEPIGSGKNDGGWGSPVVVNFEGKSGQRVYLFTHQREKIREVPRRKFPWLAPEKRVGMTDQEYQEYEVSRRNEDELIASSFVFRESVYCLEGATGATLWKNQLESHYTRFPQSGSPTVADGKIYILGAGRQVRCIDALSGRDLWKLKLPGEFRDEFWQSSFIVEDGLAVFLCGRLFAVSVEDGSIVWQGDPKTTNGSHSSPVLWKSNGRKYVVSTVGRGQTACFELETGQEAWRIQSEAGVATPVISGDRLITYGNSRKKGLR